MSDRKPSDDKRRAIEGLLGRSKEKETSPEKQDQKKSETAADSSEDRELEYVPFRLSEEDNYDPEEESARLEAVDFKVKKPDHSGLIIAATILAIGLVTSLLIIIREDVANLFTGSDNTDQVVARQQAEIERLQQELQNLRQNSEAATMNTLSQDNLKAANENLDAALRAERQKNERLNQRISELEAETAEMESSSAGDNARVAELETEIAVLRQDIADRDARLRRLQDDFQQSLERLAELRRENARISDDLEDAEEENESIADLRREISKLRDERDSLSRRLRQAQSQVNMYKATADESSTKSQQLENVNREYRRVLDLLRESREANNEKQVKIDSLMRENTDLRSRVNSLEKRVERLSNRNEPQMVSNRSVSPGQADPVLKRLVRPDYPSSAMRRKVSGVVMLRIRIDERGNVVDTEVLSSPDPQRALDRAAVEAVRKWQYEPARVNGRAVAVWHRVPLEFTLNR